MIRAAMAAAVLLAACSEPPPGVVLWHAYTSQERDALAEVAATWNRLHPETPLTLVAVPYDNFADKIISAVPGGNGPDLMIYPHDRIGDWTASSVIEPIEYWVDDALADRYADDALAAMAYRGSLYGLPLATKSLALFYRTDLVAEPPKTTDDLLAMAPAQRARGGYVLVYANGELYGHAPWLHGFGGRALDDDGELAINTEAGARSLAFARQLVTSGAALPENSGSLTAPLFNEGKAPLAMSGPWFLGDIAQGVPYKVTKLPLVSATGQPAAPYLGADGVLMSARARDKDAAFAVMAYLAGDQSAVLRAKRARQVVPNRAAYDDPEIGGDPVLAAFRAQLDDTVPMPADPTMRMLWIPYRNHLREVLAGNTSPEAALQAIDREVRSFERTP